jgi:hypothetical protein
MEEWAQIRASLGLDTRVHRRRLDELLDATLHPRLPSPGPETSWGAGLVDGRDVAVGWSADRADVLAPIDPPLLVGLLLEAANLADVTRIEEGRYPIQVRHAATSLVRATVLYVEGAVQLFGAPGSLHPYDLIAKLDDRGVGFVVRDHAVRLVGPRRATSAMAKEAVRIAAVFAGLREIAAGTSEWERALAVEWHAAGEAFELTFDQARMRLEGLDRRTPVVARLRTEHQHYVTELDVGVDVRLKDCICVPRPNAFGASFVERYSTHSIAGLEAWPPEEARRLLVDWFEQGLRPELRGGHLVVHLRGAVGDACVLRDRIGEALAIGRALEGAGTRGPYR